MKSTNLPELFDPLENAVMQCDIDKIKGLLERGARLTSTDLCLIMFLVVKGKVAILDLLLKYNDDITLKRILYIPLELAFFLKKIDVLYTLIPYVERFPPNMVMLLIKHQFPLHLVEQVLQKDASNIDFFFVREGH